MSDYAPYVELNRALAEIFLDGRFRDRPLFLDLEGSVAADLAAKVGESIEELEAYIGLVVGETISRENGNPYRFHLSLTRVWLRTQRNGPPPFIALLMALSLAAERMRADGQFSSTNYYQRLYSLLDIRDHFLRSRFTQNGKSTVAMWRIWNQYLAENDFLLGRPTAQQANSWRYVGFALSQALVRDAERECFPHLYAQNTLLPSDEISQAEMLLMLDEWIRSDGPNAWLKKIWTVQELRVRVADAALGELANWVPLCEERKHRPERLNWIAESRGFPRRRLAFYLGARPLKKDDPLYLSLAPAQGQAAQSAFSGCAEDLHLANGSTAGYSYLGPTDGLNINALLLASFRLTDKSGCTVETRTEFFHDARALIPFARIEGRTTYREVPRILLNHDCGILCHAGWRMDVEAILGKCARPGFRLVDRTSDTGLPVDWFFISNLVMVRAPEDAPDALVDLVPLEDTTIIGFQGGLQLNQGTWHREYPPEIFVVSNEMRPILKVGHSTLTGDTEIKQLEGEHGNVSLELSGLDFSKVDEISVSASRGSRLMSERNLSLRDANVPRPLPAESLAYCLDSNPWTFMSAKECKRSSQNAAVVRGMLSPESASVTLASDWEGAPILQQDTDDRGSDVPQYSHEITEGLSETCVLRGFHHYVHEPNPEGRERPGKCKDCNFSRTLRRRNSGRSAIGLSESGGTGTSREITPISGNRDSLNADPLFDAICYLGHGNATNLARISNVLSDDAWYPSEFAKNMRDLGHLDLTQSSEGTLRSWCVSPPVLVIMESGDGYLAGFRNQALVDDVERAASNAGIRFESASVSRLVPRSLFIRHIGIEPAREILGGVKDIFGRNLVVRYAPARYLADAGPTLDQIIEAMPTAGIPSQNRLSKFNSNSGRWERVQSCQEIGAFRSELSGRQYFIKTQTGACHLVPHGVAKIFAAREAGGVLHGYRECDGCFFGVLGADLPGLYPRALTSLSGMPATTVNGLWQLGNIPKDVATTILRKMYRRS